MEINVILKWIELNGITILKIKKNRQIPQAKKWSQVKNVKCKQTHINPAEADPQTYVPNRQIKPQNGFT